MKESDEYKVRYGAGAGGGMDQATKALYKNPSLNPVAAFFDTWGMELLKIGDFAPGGIIAQGLYRDLLARHLSEGLDEKDADRLAITETFNLLEETQQSGRTYNTGEFTRTHGSVAKMMLQFATSPLQQLQYETQAWREWRDARRYRLPEQRIAQARGKLLRAMAINHILMPLALSFVVNIWKWALGDEPDWEKDARASLLFRDVVAGQFGRVFFFGAMATTLADAFLFRSRPRTGQTIPMEGFFDMAAQAGMTMHDLKELDFERVRDDLTALAMKTSAPLRIGGKLFKNYALGEKKKRRERKEKKERQSRTRHAR